MGSLLPALERDMTPALRQFALSKANFSDDEDAIFIVGKAIEVGLRVAVTHEGQVFLAEVEHCDAVIDPFGEWSGLYEVEVSYLIP